MNKSKIQNAKSTNKGGNKPLKKANKQKSGMISRPLVGRGLGQSVVAPTAISRSMITRKPMIKSLLNGDCRIVHREYLQDILSSPTSGLFNVQSLPVQVASATTFPWLSQIAARFEKYHFNKLHFLFETEAPTSVGGTVILAIDYDASDVLPSTKQQALAYRGSARSAPWNECRHVSAVEDLSQLRQHFTRSGVQPVNTDINLYDVGNLFVITQGVTGVSVPLGELYVEYDVTLHTPQLQTVVTSVAGGSVVSGGTLSLTSPFGNLPVLNPASIGLTVSPTSVVTLQQLGDYLITSVVSGSGLGAMSTAYGAGVTNIFTTESINSTASKVILSQAVRVTDLAAATLDYGISAATTLGDAYFGINRGPPNAEF